MRLIALMLVLLAASSTLHSEEVQYVSDELVVQLRSGPTFSHRILKALSSGTRLNVLEMTEEDKWARVKTQDDLEGWIPAQYMSSQPAARDILKSVNNQLAKLQQQNASLKQELAEMAQKEQQAQRQLRDLDSNSKSLSEQLDTIKSVSANAIQLNTDNKRMLQENQELKNEVDVLTTDNQRLHDARNNDEFMNGAFAVLLGVFITLLVPRMWPQKRTDWA